MDLPHQHTIPGPKEQIARIVWATHILWHLTKSRSHNELLLQPDAGEEEEGGELDAETERATFIQGSRESIRSKFLDCIAQLLSPSKGWGSVAATALREREDFVEIDVARNDCFDIAGIDVEGPEQDYCRALEQFLSAGTQPGMILRPLFTDMN